MSIRFKIILVVLPVLIAAVVLAGASSYFSAASGINRVTGDFLAFKVGELQKYANSQYQLLVDNKATERPEMIEATRVGIDSFAQSLIQNPSELIFSLDESGTVVSSTNPVKATTAEGTELLSALAKSVAQNPPPLLTPTFGGVSRVAEGFYFAPFKEYYLVSDTTQSFYSDIAAIGVQTAVILIIALVLSSTLLFFFSGTLTRPLRRIAETMKDIITSGDLKKEVEVQYRDETGTLAHTFNIMTRELDKAWNEIKNYALTAALARRDEHKIRTIFQSYVPQEVIEEYEKNPESMLIGEDRVLSILFSDIRGFTSISEKMQPYDLVQNLNRYFGVMVDLIIDRGGTVDKYIGDAIMAFWGAPVKHEDDAMQSVMAGIEMSEAVETFNAEQIAQGKPEFHIGIGLNYGVVTVGNMGTEKKLNYTVIGDMVNLASRMEGLTKEYKQVLLISESLHLKVKDILPTRLLGAVKVKGKTKAVRIYTTKRTLDAREEKGWDLHNQAMGLYFERRFADAIEVLAAAEQYLPGDFNISVTKDECREYLAAPPGPDWDGSRTMEHK